VTLVAGAAAAWMSFAKDNANDDPNTWVNGRSGPEGMPEDEEVVDPREPAQDAVMVFGASGKTGREVVATLLRSGRDVVAAVRDASKLDAALAELQGEVALTETEKERLFVRAGVDVTDPATLSPDLFAGVQQVVTALGPIFGKLPEGGFGYFDGMTSEKVDSQGVKNIVAAAAQYLPKQERAEEMVMQFFGAGDLAAWNPLDDVIMGGNSSSAWVQGAENTAVWQGDLVFFGGGFCGTRSMQLDRDLSKFDGISLRVKGDGQRYKLNLKTSYNAAMPEYTYQAGFDTVDGEWTTIDLPFNSFVPVKMGNELSDAPALDASLVSTLGMVLSRFEFNGLPNPRHREGPFRLEVQHMAAFRNPRPQFVHMSSGGVERNARIETEEDRKNCVMPIVQLNPGGTLNFKYDGETAVRSSGLQYSVVRSSGLVTENLDKTYVLQGLQGDMTTGKISRGEVGRVLAAAIGESSAINKTFEVRRGDEENAELKHNMHSMFTTLAVDTDRSLIGIRPFPAPGPPKGMPDENRKQEILKDERVVASMKRGDGGRVRSEEEAPDGTSEANDDLAAATGKMITVLEQEKTKAEVNA